MPPTLSDLLKIHRAASGLSLAQVAAKLTAAGVQKTRAAVHQWERGSTRPPREALEAIAVAFDLDVSQATQLYMAAGYVVLLTSPASA